MDETKSQKKEPKEHRKFSQEQYEMLLRCSKKADMTEWNEWCEANPSQEILLEGAKLVRANLKGAELGGANLQGADLWEANLQGAHLSGANLQGAEVRGANLEGANLGEANLKGAKLVQANLQGANLGEVNLKGAKLWQANLKGANLRKANLKGAELSGANLQGADLFGAKLEGANLRGANLQGAYLWGANLQGANLVRANLEGADLSGANLEGADLSGANLEGANCSWAKVNGSTLIAECIVDRDTDFLGVGLGSARIEPELRQLLECSIRRRKWEKWYKGEPFLNKAVRWFWFASDYGRDNRSWQLPLKCLRFISDRCSRISFMGSPFQWLGRWYGYRGRCPLWKQLACWFWWMSDYGRLTGRIIGVFFVLAIVFATVYYLSGLGGAHCIVDNLFADKHGVEVSPLLAPFRAFYFSVVTMTTLGFGDMHANAHSFWGHLLLTLQVLLGYMLLAALVTRFAILFTAGGPAGKFAKKSRQVDTPKTNRSG